MGILSNFIDVVLFEGLVSFLRITPPHHPYGEQKCNKNLLLLYAIISKNITNVRFLAGVILNILLTNTLLLYDYVKYFLKGSNDFMNIRRSVI